MATGDQLPLPGVGGTWLPDPGHVDGETVGVGRVEFVAVASYSILGRSIGRKHVGLHAAVLSFPDGRRQPDGKGRVKALYGQADALALHGAAGLLDGCHEVIPGVIDIHQRLGSPGHVFVEGCFLDLRNSRRRRCRGRCGLYWRAGRGRRVECRHLGYWPLYGPPMGDGMMPAASVGSRLVPIPVGRAGRYISES